MRACHAHGTRARRVGASSRPSRDARDGTARMMTSHTMRARRDGCARAWTTRARGSSDDAEDDVVNDVDANDGLSSSFAEELRKRERARAAEASTNPFERLASGRAPRFASSDDDGRGGRDGDQLARSRALNAEGLEGFPARAAELLKLGFASFLGFGPFIALASVAFCLTYLLFGSDFIHGGESGYAPAFVPAEVLLAEPTVDRMVPFYPSSS